MEISKEDIKQLKDNIKRLKNDLLRYSKPKEETMAMSYDERLAYFRIYVDKAHAVKDAKEELKRAKRIVDGWVPSQKEQEFQRLRKEAKERLERDPTSNPLNMDLSLFDVDKRLARPYGQEKNWHED